MTYPPSQARADYEDIVRAIRALSNAWVNAEPPSNADGLLIASRANIAAARMAVHAGVPPGPFPPLRAG